MPRSFAFTTNVENARTGLRSSRTASVPTGSAVIASWPTPFACSYTPSPTTWSTGSASTCLPPYVLLKSKPCALSCSRSAPAFALPLAVSASTWPAAGLSSLCFKPWPDSATPAELFVSFRTHSLLLVTGGALSQNAFPIVGYPSCPCPISNLSLLLPLTLDSNNWPVTFQRWVESRTGAVAVVFRWLVARLSLRRLSPAWLGSVSCSRSSNRTGAFCASGSRRKVHDVTHGRLAVLEVSRTNPNSSCRSSSGNRLVPDPGCLCLAHSHRRSRRQVCRSTAR